MQTAHHRCKVLTTYQFKTKKTTHISKLEFRNIDRLKQVSVSN